MTKTLSSVLATGSLGSITQSSSVALTGVSATCEISEYGYLLQEDGSRIMLEDSSGFIILEGGLTPIVESFGEWIIRARRRGRR